MTVKAPGTTGLVLEVKNTGNDDDRYTVAIIGTTGPVTASLIGPDGLPAQSIALFVLPALGTADLPLQATLNGPGQGTITVLVKSLTTGQESTVVATVSGQSTVIDGPQVLLVQRYGVHMNPTTIVLTFDQPLNPTLADNVNEYRLLDPQGHVVPISSAVYDAATDTVTLHPRNRINLHRTYRLTVVGVGPNGLTDSSGLLLDGKKSGQPGSNYVTTINGRNLVLPPNWNPAWSRKAPARKTAARFATGHPRPFHRSSTLVKLDPPGTPRERLVPARPRPALPRRSLLLRSHH